MKKTPSLYRRDPVNMARLLPEPNPLCEWVFAGEGVAAVKLDGICVMLDDAGAWWARREVKPGKTEPVGWVPVEADPATGKRFGWEPVERSAFAKLHRNAVDPDRIYAPATYELVGPKIKGNPHAFPHTALHRHGEMRIYDVPLEFGALREWLLQQPAPGRPSYIEGVVWWRDPADPNSDRCKIKIRDFTNSSNRNHSPATESESQ